jgi:trigger factor
MNIVTTKTSGLTTDFKITIPSSVIAGKISSWLQEKSKYVRIDGFRPGKVPLNIVHQRYGQQATQDVLEEAIKENTQKVLHEHSIRPVLQPVYAVDPYEDGKDFSFSLSVDRMPEISLKDFKSIKVEKLVVEIGEKEIESALKTLAERYTKFKPSAANYKLKEGDRATVSLVCEDSNKKTIKSYSGDKVNIVVGKDEIGLGFVEEKLLGHKAGDKVTVDHAFAKDYQDKAVAGKKVVFKVEITEVAQPEKIKVGEDLAKELGCEGLKDLKDKINGNLQKEHDSLAKIYHKRSVLDALESSYKFELPSRMVKAEFDSIWNHLQQEIANAKASGEYEDDGDTSETELKSEYEKIAERRVRLGLLIAEVSKADSIRVSPEIARNVIFKEAMKYPGQEKEVIQFYRDNPQEIERLTSPVLEDLVVEHIFSQSTHKEVKVSVKQLEEKLRGVLPGYGEDEDVEAKPKKETKSTAKPKVAKEAKAEPKATKETKPKKK